jgi:hypothetical protein
MAVIPGVTEEDVVGAARVLFSGSAFRSGTGLYAATETNLRALFQHGWEASLGEAPRSGRTTALALYLVLTGVPKEPPAWARKSVSEWHNVILVSRQLTLPGQPR